MEIGACPLMDDVGRIATFLQNRVTTRPPVPSAEITRVKDAKRHQIRLHLIGRWRYPLIVPMNEATEAGTFFFLNIQCSSGSSEWATTSPISQTLIRTEPLMCCWDIGGFLA